MSRGSNESEDDRNAADSTAMFSQRGVNRRSQDDSIIHHGTSLLSHLLRLSSIQRQIQLDLGAMQRNMQQHFECTFENFVSILLLQNQKVA
jgi:hypothetical protein